ncbi:MAG TPA: ABC-F family ATP-binding cassette domain-containing protein [Salinivirgaceae bacterium]|nr:ABC-F family ATP-binding cassette domain-containing protein [Salinivirgaceae bacterium]
MISVNQLSVRFGGFTLFENISFLINPRDRIGLIGRNGIGKSTLMKILCRQMSDFEGSISFPNSCTLGYLPQHLSVSDTCTLVEETAKAFEEINQIEKLIESLNQKIASSHEYTSPEYLANIARLTEATERYHLLGGDKRDAQIEQTLKGLGFLVSDFNKPTSEFSGGWRMQIELAKLILQKPNLLMLDEPTNHLDIESIEWLENYLKDYPGAVILISHDRRFLDSITNRTIEIANKRIYDYPVAYSKYIELMEQRLETQKAAFENQQKKIKDTEAFIERFRYKATKAIQVQSRIKALEKLERIEIDTFDTKVMNLKFPPAPRSGDIVVECENISVSYQTYRVLDSVNLLIERGEKVAFVGRNGEGKTTMVKVILDQVPHHGIKKIGHNVTIGYYAQNQIELLNPKKTVLQTIDDIAVGDIRTKVRDILGAFLFSGDDIDKPVAVLSGGEKARLSLACMLLKPINLLIMDEPTHHLDMLSKDILKSALLNYDGALILVSHDRDFLDGLTDKIFEFRDKKIREHLGGINQFLDKRRLERLQDLNSTRRDEQQPNKPSNTESKEQYLKRKEFEKELRKIQVKIQKLEEEIHQKEKKLEEIGHALAQPENLSNQNLYLDYNQIKNQIEQLSEMWLSLTEEYDNVSKNNG